MAQTVDISTAVAKWLNGHGGLAEDDMEPGKAEGRVQLKLHAANALRNGKARTRGLRRHAARVRWGAGRAPCVASLAFRGRAGCPHRAQPRAAFSSRCSHRAAQAVAALVTSLYAEGGALCPINTLALRDGDSVDVRLYNWNALLPSLEKAFAIKLTPDEKTLLIGGGARGGGVIAADRGSTRRVLAPPLRSRSGRAARAATLTRLAAPRRAAAEPLEHIIEMLHSRGGGVGKPALLPSPTRKSKAKQWAAEFDEDRIATIIITFAQMAGVYACIMARRRMRHARTELGSLR
jgi:hypothetical protein